MVEKYVRPEYQESGVAPEMALVADIAIVAAIFLFGRASTRLEVKLNP